MRAACGRRARPGAISGSIVAGSPGRPRVWIPMNGISPLTWPLDSREEAVAAVARATGLSRPDTEEIEAEFDELDALLRAAPPALLRLEIDGKERLLAVARRRGSRLIALAPDGTERA